MYQSRQYKYHLYVHTQYNNLESSTLDQATYSVQEK
jgi:hypothetical protein